MDDDDLIDAFADTMETTITMWIKQAHHTMDDFMFMIADEAETRIMMLQQDGPKGSWMAAGGRIDGCNLFALTEEAFTKAIGDDALDPHKGKGWVRVVVMRGDEFDEHWREMRLLAN